MESILERYDYSHVDLVKIMTIFRQPLSIIVFHVVHLSVTYWCSFFMDCHETAGVELYQNCFLS